MKQVHRQQQQQHHDTTTTTTTTTTPEVTRYQAPRQSAKRRRNPRWDGGSFGPETTISPFSLSVDNGSYSEQQQQQQQQNEGQPQQQTPPQKLRFQQEDDCDCCRRLDPNYKDRQDKTMNLSNEGTPLTEASTPHGEESPNSSASTLLHSSADNTPQLTNLSRIYRHTQADHSLEHEHNDDDNSPPASLNDSSFSFLSSLSVDQDQAKALFWDETPTQTIKTRPNKLHSRHHVTKTLFAEEDDLPPTISASVVKQRKTALPQDDDDEWRGTLIIPSKTKRFQKAPSLDGSVPSQDSSCSHSTLSSLEESLYHHLHRQRKTGREFSRAMSSHEPLLTSSWKSRKNGKMNNSYWRLKSSTTRLILWVWTLIGLLSTSGLVLYQFTFLDHLLAQAQRQSLESRLVEFQQEQQAGPTGAARLVNLAQHPWRDVVTTSKVTQPPPLVKVNAPTLVNAESLQTKLPERSDLNLDDTTISQVVLPPAPSYSLAQHVIQTATALYSAPPPPQTTRPKQPRGSTPMLHNKGDDGSQPFPRVISMDGLAIDNSQVTPHRQMELYPAEYTDQTQLYGLFDSDDERIQGMEPRQPLVNGECVPMKDWQTTFYPSCNDVHSLGLAHLGDQDGHSSNSFDLFGTKGYWRNAWKVESSTTKGQNDTFVLKTLKIEHRFEAAHFEHDRVDAVAMERLTASDHVINIFGFCGHSVVTEYADGKRLGTLADKSKKVPLARLRIAHDISQGLADVHGIDGDDMATFVHLDINPANVVSINGTLKLNDFNIGILRQWNTTSNSPCGFPAQYPNPQWRSPEEARDEVNLTEKVDVFSMGHIFFRLICGHEPWNKFESGGKPSKAAVTEAVRNGDLPTVPRSIMESNDPEVISIRDAMLACYTSNPVERPSARQIAFKLQRDLERLEERARAMSHLRSA